MARAASVVITRPLVAAAQIRQALGAALPPWTQSDSAIIFRDGPSGARRRFPCLASGVWGIPAAGSTYGGTNEERHAPGFSRHLLAALIPSHLQRC